MRQKLPALVLLSAFTLLAACKSGQKEAATSATEMTEQDKALYALGALVSHNLEPFEFSSQELEQVKRGLSDALGKKPLAVEPEKYQDKIGELHQARIAAAGKRNAEAGQAYIEKAAVEPGAVKTESGVIITELKAGTGATPTATDQVKVHYHGTLIDGTVFDSSVKRGEPATFPLNRVIPCWTEGVQRIKVGGKSRLVCPPALAYGDQGSPPVIKPGSTLIFEVELLDIVK